MDAALAWKGWNGVPNPLVGNGLCDDKSNNDGCNYDTCDYIHTYFNVTVL